jgi:thiamine pyrophosphokinase
MKALLIGNAKHLDESTALKLASEADLVIGVDGGANHCLRLGLKPKIIVGDMDSLSGEARSAFSKTCEFQTHPTDKSELDLELAYQCARAKGAQSVDIVGWSDERVDFSLAALIGLQTAELPLCLWTESTQIRLLNAHQPELELTGPSRLSIIGVSSRIGLQSEGLRWELNWAGEGPKISQSNEFLQRARLWVREGAAYALLEKQVLSMR